MFQYVSFFFFFCTLSLPASGQAVVTGVIPSPPRFLPSIFIAHRVQQSHCSSIFHRTLLTHALALSASQFVHKKKSQRIYTSMHSAGLELTKLTYTRLEDSLIRPRGDRLPLYVCMTHREPHSTARAAGTAHTLLGTNYLEVVQDFVLFRGKRATTETSRNQFQRMRSLTSLCGCFCAIVANYTPGEFYAPLMHLK